jgi:hypothetical protein
VKQRSYPYKPSTLDFLINKTVLFLVDYFHQVFQNLGTSDAFLGNSEPPKKRQKRKEQTQQDDHNQSPARKIQKHQKFQKNTSLLLWMKWWILEDYLQGIAQLILLVLICVTNVMENWRSIKPWYLFAVMVTTMIAMTTDAIIVSNSTRRGSMRMLIVY